MTFIPAPLKPTVPNTRPKSNGALSQIKASQEAVKTLLGLYTGILKKSNG